MICLGAVRPWHPTLAGLLLAVLAAPAVLAQQTSVAALAEQAPVRAALAAVRAAEPRTIDDQVRFCEVPAPSFQEKARGELLRREFLDLGLQNVRVDRVGNVLGDRPGLSDRPRLVLAAHLDTVFPDGTNVKVKRAGTLLRGPGVGDDCRGLAELVAVARALGTAGIRTPGSITFVADVGEEGLGDLSGMKALFGETMKDQVDRFVSIDGGGLNIVAIGVGSRRYRMTFHGPGGHSFAAFGVANPADAMGRAIAKIAEFRVPDQPATTFNVGRVGGGISVNSIPTEAWMEIDLRSSEPSALAALDLRLQAAVDAAAAEENQRWGTPRVITVSKQLVGDRPVGSTREDSPIVQAAIAVARVLGLTAPIAEGSGDQNLPMSLKIPAIGVGFGGRDIDPHAPTEAFDTTDAWKGTQNALLLTVALAR